MRKWIGITLASIAFVLLEVIAAASVLLLERFREGLVVGVVGVIVLAVGLPLAIRRGTSKQDEEWLDELPHSPKKVRTHARDDVPPLASVAMDARVPVQTVPAAPKSLVYEIRLDELARAQRELTMAVTALRRDIADSAHATAQSEQRIEATVNTRLRSAEERQFQTAEQLKDLARRSVEVATLVSSRLDAFQPQIREVSVAGKAMEQTSASLSARFERLENEHGRLSQDVHRVLALTESDFNSEILRVGQEMREQIGLLAKKAPSVDLKAVDERLNRLEQMKIALKQEGAFISTLEEEIETLVALRDGLGMIRATRATLESVSTQQGDEADPRVAFNALAASMRRAVAMMERLDAHLSTNVDKQVQRAGQTYSLPETWQLLQKKKR